MKLSIVVTHYNEPADEIENLFNSIRHQRLVPWSEVELHIVEDGTTPVPDDLTADYPCDVYHHFPEHGGVSAARNYGFEHSKGDYVMFCDCDDMFLNALGIHLIFTAIEESPEIISSAFIEETRDDKGMMRIVRHDNDMTFIHGKAYRRAFLKREYLKFDKELTIHEDGYFNNLAFTLARTKKYIETPFYLWCWRDGSICRKEEFVLKTYPELMRVRTALTEKLKDKGLDEEYKRCVISTVVFAYYDFQKPAYTDKQYADYIIAARKSIRKYYQRYKDMIRGATRREIADAMYAGRLQAFKNGMLYENMTLAQFIRVLEE